MAARCLSARCQVLPVRRWSEHDGVHEAAQGLRSLDTTFGLLQRSGEFRDLRAVDAGHLRVQKRRRLVRRLQLRLQFLPTAVEGLHLDLALVHRDLVVQHQVQQLLDARADPRDLALRGTHAGALGHPKPVHLTRELLAEFLEQLGKKSPLTLKHFEDFAATLATRADSDRSWTVDLAARRTKAAEEALPFRETARAKTREADRAKDDLAALKKAKPRDEAAIAASEATLRDLLTKTERRPARPTISRTPFTIRRPSTPTVNRRSIGGRRLNFSILVESKGVEIAEALKKLRALTS